MSFSLKEIEEQVRRLPAEDRARLIEILLESLHSSDSDIESEWMREVEERVAAFDRGQVSAYAAEDVFAEARRLSG